MSRPVVALSAAIALALSSAPAAAKEIVVHMKNSGADGAMVFEPAFVKAAPGDTVRFIPSDPSHNAEAIAAIWPQGTAPVKGPMSRELKMTVKAPGLYGIKCMPHYSMGMVALIQVGKPAPAQVTAARAAKLPPMAGRRMSVALGRVK